MNRSAPTWAKPICLIFFGAALLALGAGFHLKKSASDHGGNEAGIAARNETGEPLSESNALSRQFREDLVGALHSRARSVSLCQWQHSGLVPGEILKNARAIKLPGASTELCKALLTLNGSELATFEPALPALGSDDSASLSWLPCLHSIRRRIERHWDKSRDRLQASPIAKADAPAPVASSDPVRAIEFTASTLLNGEELAPGEVALTFDGGPDANRTSRILAILKENGVRATFFLAGAAASANPAIALQIRQDGHAIGALTWSNESLREADLKTGEKEIARGVQAVGGSSGGPVPFFRFPFGDNRDAFDDVLNRHHLVSVGWNIDAWEWRSSEPREALEHLFQELDQKHGGIVLLHDGLTQTEILLPTFLRGMRARHLTPVVLGN